LGKIKEEHFFKNLGETLNCLELKNITVLSGWSDKGRKEFDFLILYETLKIIYHVEVKNSLSFKNMNKAGDQLQNGYEMFSSKIPFPSSENWTYLKAMYFAEENLKQEEKLELTPCAKCTGYVWNPETNLLNIFTQKSLSEKLKPCQAKNYLLALKFLLFKMFIQEDCITEKDILDNTTKIIDNIFDPENQTGKNKSTQSSFFFTTTEQYMVLSDPNKKRVCFTSDFGTGKTTLILSKINELLKTEKEEVVVIIWSKLDSCLLLQNYKNKFLEKKRIKIFGFKPSGNVLIIYVFKISLVTSHLNYIACDIKNKKQNYEGKMC